MEDILFNDEIKLLLEGKGNKENVSENSIRKYLTMLSHVDGNQNSKYYKDLRNSINNPPPEYREVEEGKGLDTFGKI